MEHRNLEQRCAIKLCVKLGESASVTFEKLKQSFGEQCLSRAQVFRWHKSFLKGREHVKDEPRSGRPSTSKTDENIDRVRALLRSGRRLTIRMISKQLNLNTFTVHQIMTKDLNLRKDHSKHFNSSKDADNKLDCDDEEDEGEEEENYNAHNGLGLAIKVEPGLAEEDSMSEYHTFKEEIRDPLDTSVDIDTTIPIKQENNYSYEDSSIGEINIKEEPDSSDDDFNDILSQDCAMDSGEECNESNELSFDDKDYEIDGILHPNDAKDDCQVFGDFVAEELRKLKSEENRKKLKRVVQRVILKISESET